MKVFKILIAIFSLLVIILGEKLGFPLGLLAFLEIPEEGFEGFLGISFFAIFFYLLVSAGMEANNKIDDLIIMGIIVLFYIFLLTQLQAFINYSEPTTLTLLLVFVSILLLTFILVFKRFLKRYVKHE